MFRTKVTRTLLLVAAAFVLVGAAQPAIAAPSTAPSAAANFSLSANPTSVTIKRGGTAVYNIHVQGVNGFNGTVNFTVADVENHDTGSFTNVPVVGTGNATLNIHSVGHQSPIGTEQVTVTGTSGSLSHSITVLCTVSF